MNRAEIAIFTWQLQDKIVYTINKDIMMKEGEIMPFFIIAGAINAAIAVALGAFGAHALKDKLSERYLAIWETAVQYQMFHALGLLAIGILMSSSLLGPSTTLSWAGYLLLGGIIIFSGSLYALSLSGIGVLGAITPIGGVAFIVGWLLLIIAAVKFGK